jgi:hypothetical protein
MKKNRHIWWLILSILLLSCALFCGSVDAQEKKVSLHISNAELPVILDTLESRFGVYFSYDADLASLRNTKSIDTTGTLKEFIDILFDGENVRYSYIGKQVVLFQENCNVSKPQSDSLPYIVIKGKVLDQSNRSPLVFASVCISGNSLGTTTNSDGDFIFKIPSRFFKDSLVVIYCGYKAFRKAIKDILPTGKMEIMLEVSAQVLEPVIIKPVDAQAIVSNVLKKAGENYPRKAALCTAFFRESSKSNNEYFTICEAVIDIHKGAYQNNFDNDQARIFKSRKSENEVLIKDIQYKIEGGIMNCLRLDVVKDQASFLLPEEMENYDYAYVKTVMFDGQELYVISFDQKKDVQLPLFKGLLYIEKNTNALVAAKFGLSPRGIGYAKSLLVKKYPRKVKVKPIDASYLVNYRNLNGKWYLDNIRTELQIKVRSDRLFFNTLYTSVTEMSITEIDTVNVKKFKLREIIKENDAMSDYEDIYDPGFWGNYNLISPEEPLVEAIKKLSIKQNLVHQHKNFWDLIF